MPVPAAAESEYARVCTRHLSFEVISKDSIIQYRNRGPEYLAFAAETGVNNFDTWTRFHVHVVSGMLNDGCRLVGVNNCLHLVKD